MAYQGIEAVKNSILDSFESNLHGFMDLNSIIIGKINTLKDLHPVYGNWISGIFLGNEKLKVTIKIFYNLNQIIGNLKFHSKEQDPDKISKNTHSNMKEISNATCAGLKRFLEISSINVGMSLPILTRGVDEIYENPNNLELFDINYYEVIINKNYLVLQTIIEVNESESIKNLQYEKNIISEDDSDDNDYDFL